MSFELNLTHPSKHVPWGGDTTDADIVVLGEDLSTSSFKMTFAATLGGAAVMTLNNASAGSEGVSADYDSSYVHPDTREVVGATVIRPQANEATLEALTWGSDASADLVLYYDLIETPLSGLQKVICYGTYTLSPGVGD